MVRDNWEKNKNSEQQNPCFKRSALSYKILHLTVYIFRIIALLF